MVHLLPPCCPPRPRPTPCPPPPLCGATGQGVGGRRHGRHPQQVLFHVTRQQRSAGAGLCRQQHGPPRPKRSNIATPPTPEHISTPAHLRKACCPARWSSLDSGHHPSACPLCCPACLSQRALRPLLSRAAATLGARFCSAAASSRRRRAAAATRLVLCSCLAPSPPFCLFSTPFVPLPSPSHAPSLARSAPRPDLAPLRPPPARPPPLPPPFCGPPRPPAALAKPTDYRRPAQVAACGDARGSYSRRAAGRRQPDEEWKRAGSGLAACRHAGRQGRMRGEPSRSGAGRNVGIRGKPHQRPALLLRRRHRVASTRPAAPLACVTDNRGCLACGAPPRRACCGHAAVMLRRCPLRAGR